MSSHRYLHSLSFKFRDRTFYDFQTIGWHYLLYNLVRVPTVVYKMLLYVLSLERILFLVCSRQFSLEGSKVL